MLTYMPDDSARAHVKELVAAARPRQELEALAVRTYERAAQAFRVYVDTFEEPAVQPASEPRRSMAYRAR